MEMNVRSQSLKEATANSKQAAVKQADLVPLMLQQNTENRAAEPSWGTWGEPEEVLRV